MVAKTKLWLASICILTGLSISGCTSSSVDYITASPSAPINETVKESNSPIIEKSGDHATVASNSTQQANSQNNPIPVFSPKQPKIIGLAIGEPQEKVIIQYGKPLESYIMEDATEPFSVYQYEGFSIGFNSANEIQFIDISSADINPGLNGLRLGQTSAQALEVLGKPDKNTSYVISYNTKTATLKLDIDPKTKTIQSIKLFAVNES